TTVAVSASMVKTTGSTIHCGCFDKDYFDELILDRFKDGTIGEAPVIPGTGMFMPIASAVWKDKGLFRLTVPRFIAHLCTGCMECALACPDGAIPNTVHDIHDVLLTAIKSLDITAQHKEMLSSHVYPLSTFIRDQYRKLPGKEPTPFHEILAQAITSIDTNSPTVKQNLDKLIDLLACYPLTKTRPFFDAMEKAVPGSGGLYSVNVDPWKCTGCMECVDVCGPGALLEQRQNSEVSISLQHAFEFLSKLPNTPPRFFNTATRMDGDTKRLLLDHDSYYAMTGGHGACRGCGEVTAIRLIMAANRTLHQERYKQHILELEELIAGLKTKIEEVGYDNLDPLRLPRLQDTIETLERRLYYFESGPTGNGPASAMIANATGCSSVYVSTFPYNPYTDPWVNSLFQDTAPLAKGLFEGMSADLEEDFKAIRIAKLDLEDHYDPDTQDRLFKYFHWSQFSDQELALLPSVIAMGGDGAIYDIGFGALSRLLTTNTPIKIVVLNTGSYSNTGGQASTASFTAQDSDLSRFGVVHGGKQEHRKELGLIAAFHPRVLVIQSTAALPGHFMKNVMIFLNNNTSPALLDVYTVCQSEHGAADNAAMRRAKLAVDSRMNPVFVHDPCSGETLAERFSLQGNPDLDQDWTTITLQYSDQEGKPQLKEIPLTPADFAADEGRFKKHFHPLSDDDTALPVPEYIQLSSEQRYGKTPFIWSTDSGKRLLKLAVSAPMIELTEERLGLWHMLQYLSGLHVDRLEETHRRQLDEWQRKYQQSSQDRAHSIDVIARGMSELATASAAPTVNNQRIAKVPVSAISLTPTTRASADQKTGTETGLPLVSITDDDMAKCTDCKTCYQDLSELFEKTTIIVDGEAKDIGRVISGVFEKIDMTPELIHRAAHIADDCDAEIIRFNRP
ncbi:MAG: thiamine pyrophosphate-dependent enzyme, partial [Pseudomonadota bacterium]